MKFKLTLIIIFIIHLNITAQINFQSNTKNYIGYQARLIDLMPSEISFLHINNDGLSFAIRGGYGEGSKNNVPVYNLSNIRTYNTYNTDFKQSFEVYFIKTGVVISKLTRPTFSVLHLINFNSTFANEKATFKKYDPLYGIYSTEYKEQNNYYSVEYEANIIHKLTSKIHYGMGYMFGIKINNHIPFKKVIPGIQEGSSYTPSQGFGNGFYINISLSLMYKL